jgi:hypothetical protein
VLETLRCDTISEQELAAAQETACPGVVLAPTLHSCCRASQVRAPETIAAFLAAEADREFRPVTIARRAAAIAAAHRAQDHPQAERRLV